MRYPSLDDIIGIHELVVATTGGGTGLREPGLLASIVAKPQASFGGEELYPLLPDKAAALYEALVNYHVFIDGNKRTAAMVMYRMLAINGHELTASNSELERYTLMIATTNPELANVAAWVQKHSRPL